MPTIVPLFPIDADAPCSHAEPSAGFPLHVAIKDVSVLYDNLHTTPPRGSRSAATKRQHKLERRGSPLNKIKERKARQRYQQAIHTQRNTWFQREESLRMLAVQLVPFARSEAERTLLLRILHESDRAVACLRELCPYTVRRKLNTLRDWREELTCDDVYDLL